MTDNTPTTKQDEGGLVTVPREPTEDQWGGLARSIMMWLDFSPHTPRTLFKHLSASGVEIPDWLRNEPEMRALDHVPSKGTRCALIYKAMLDAAPTTPPHNEDGLRKLAERMHQAADDIVSGETIFSDRVHGLLWEAADALSRQALGDIPSG